MSFYKRYELQRLVADGDVKTFRAVDNTTNRPVFLHMFNPAGFSLLELLKARLAGADGKPRPPLIEIGVFAGAPYAVTETIGSYTNLRDWLGTLTEEPPPVPASPPPDAPGEFTRMFGNLPVQPASAIRKPSTVLQGPGEFTQRFSMPPAAPSPKATDTDEFEKWIENPDLEATKQQPAWPAAAPDAREFTGLFGLGPSGEEINIDEEQARAAKSATPENRPFAEAGEFTRMFGPQNPVRTTQRPRDATPPARSTSASGIFDGREESKVAFEPGVEAGDKRPKTETLPGEYTRMIAVPRVPEPPPADKPLAPVPESSTKWTLILWIGIPVLVVIIVVVIELVLSKS